MNFSELAKERYSCKKFKNQPVSPEQLDIILEAGRVAPTAKNIQPQRIYVIQSDAGLQTIDHNTPCRYGAKTVIAVGFCKDSYFVYPGGKHNSAIEDATIVATHMILQAADLGVDSCWLNLFDPEKLAEELGLPENVEIVMLMDIGYAAEGAGPLPNHSIRKEKAETVSWL